MSVKSIIATTLSLFFLSSCTSLESKKISGQTTTPSGLTYRLPAKKFTVTATFEVTGCTAQGSNALMEAVVSSELTESLVGGEAYTLNYKKLNAWTKITNTDFQLSDAGLLTGVNASIADQSGAVLANSVSSIASVARAVALPAISIPLHPRRLAVNQDVKSLDLKVGQKFSLSGKNNLKLESPGLFERLGKFEGRNISFSDLKEVQAIVAELEDPCEKVVAAVAEKKAKEKELASEKVFDKKRAEAKAKVDQSVLDVVALGSLIEFYDKLGDEGEKRNLLKRTQLAEKDKKEAEIILSGLGASKYDEIQAAIEKLKNKLTVAAAREFVPKSKDNVCSDGDGAAEAACQVTIKKKSLEALFGSTVRVEEVELPIVVFSVDQIKVSSGDEQLDPDFDNLGIAYRIPVPATVVVKYKNKPSDSVYHRLIERVTQVPQLGPIGSIDLDNIAFDDNLIEVAFNPATGSPSKLVFRAKSKAEAASSSAQSAAGTFLQLQKDKQADAVSASRTTFEQANSQLAYEKAVSELSSAKTQSGILTAKAQADLQQHLVSSQLQLLRDQQRLDAVRTGTASAAEVELESLNTQEQLLAQRLKIMRLEREIARQGAEPAGD